ncbi:MAG: zf-HC2 domain-containing protein, partial [Lachnospiraceae bacterium]|nr:zf-HC2 domain-containing protein [Lachnospiraceae bacterium]
REAEKMVVSYIHDELTIDELDDFLDHVESCDNCMEELEIHYMVDVGLKKLDEDDATYDIVGDLMRKLESSARELQRFSVFQITKYAVSTLMSMWLLLAVMLQIRIWHQAGFLFF